MAGRGNDSSKGALPRLPNSTSISFVRTGAASTKWMRRHTSDTGMVVGELLVAMRNAELAQPSYEPAGTVEQIELIFLSAVDVERLQPAEIVRLGFDRNDRILS